MLREPHYGCGRKNGVGCAMEGTASGEREGVFVWIAGNC